jgi:beta-lactamase class D
MKNIFLLFIIPILFGGCVQSTTEMPEWKDYFDTEGFRGCVIIDYPNSNQTLYLNRKRCYRKYSPAETFDILNSLIALQAKAIKTVNNDTLIWPKMKLENTLWNKDQNMISAYKNSCPWFYKEMARIVGGKNMTCLIDSIDCYGTMNRVGDVETFWTDGSFEISADQQIEFLKRLYKEDLPFEKNHIKDIKKIMIDYKDNIRVLRVKSGVSFSNKVVWYIGWIEYKSVPCFFALNLSFSNQADSEKARLAAKRILQKILIKRKLIDENIKWN